MRKKIIYRETGEPYLVRWYLFRCKKFQICLHHILLSDYDCLHDHPWAFWTFVFKGGYFERTPKYDVETFEDACYTVYSLLKGGMAVTKKWIRPFSFLKRPAKWKHALELPEGKTAWSLLIMFRKEREWGFWTKLGWQHYEVYDSKQSCE